MNLKKLAAALTALLTLAGPPDTALAAEAGPIIEVTDGIGRVVRVPKNPARVASVFSPAAHLIGMLGDSEKIVAMSAGNRRDKLFMDLYPAVAQARVPAGLGGSGGLNVEELFRDPAPEIIFCDSGQVYDENIMAKIEKFGVPVVVIDFRSVAELKAVVSMVGEIMGREDRARIYCEYIDKTERLIAERMRDMPPGEKRGVYRAVNELLRAEAVNSVPGEWITRLGIRLIGAAEVEDVNNSKNYISLETLLSYDPPCIIVTGANVYEHLQTNRQLHVLSAYKNKKIFLLPNGISRWAHQYSIEVAPAMLWVFKTVYPERFADIDMQEETRAFYREVFAADLDDATIGQILAGRDLRVLKGRSAMRRGG